MKLSNARYESIKKDVVKVLSKYNINTIPIDPFQLAKRMGISLIKYSEMDDCDTLVSNQLQKDGFIVDKINYNGHIITSKGIVDNGTYKAGTIYITKEDFINEKK